MPVHFYLRKTCHECGHAMHLHIGVFWTRWQFLFKNYESILESVSDWKEHIAQQTTNGWRFIDEDGREYSPAVFWSLVGSGRNGKLQGRHFSSEEIDRRKFVRVR
jgi:hypothetical protein